MRRFRNVAGAVRIQREHRIIHGGHVARWDQHLGETRVRTAERFRRKVARNVVLVRIPRSAGRPRRVQPHQCIQLIFQDHHHVGPPQQPRSMTRLSTLGGHRRITRFRDDLPVFEGGALIVTPVFRARIECRKSTSVSVKPRLFQSAARRAELLMNLEAERHRQFLLWIVARSKFLGGAFRPSASATQ